jgi:hypothetical protein
MVYDVLAADRGSQLAPAAWERRWRGNSIRAGHGHRRLPRPGVGAEFFLVDGVLVAVTHAPKRGKHAFAYTAQGRHAFDLQTGVPNARRISEEEFMVRLAHIQLSRAGADAERPNMPDDVQK